MKLLIYIGFLLSGLLLTNIPLFSQVKPNQSLTSKKEVKMENQSKELKELVTDLTRQKK